MRRLIDLQDIWESAGRIAEAKLAAFGVESVPELPKTCPFTLDELLVDRFDVRKAVQRIEAST